MREKGTWTCVIFKEWTMLLGILMIAAPSFSQITFTNVAGTASDQSNIAFAKDGGCSFADFDLDGDLDLVVNTNDNNAARRSYLLRNDNGVFTDVTNSIAPDLKANGLTERTAAWGDCNNDGYPDLLVNNSGRLKVLLNSGGTSLSTIFEITGMTDGFNTEGAGWIDYDMDGDLDFFVENHNFGVDIFSNDGAASPTFTQVTINSVGAAGTGAGGTGLPEGGSGTGDYGTTTDLNLDGYPDILVRRQNSGSSTGQDLNRDDIFINDGDGTFTANTTLNDQAQNGNKGGVIAADFDGDGDFDILWTSASLSGNLTVVYENTGTNSMVFNQVANPFVLDDGTAEAGTDFDGCAIGDIDNDGDLDLFMTQNSGTSKLYLNLSSGAGNFSFRQPGPTWIPGATINFGINVNGNGEGCVFADYDNDGDVDLYVNRDGGNQLWQNDYIGSATESADTYQNNYLRVIPQVDLGGGVTRPAVNAIVRFLDCDGNTISGVREVGSGGAGHGSQTSPWLLYGLPNGPDESYLLEVRFTRNGTTPVVVRRAVTPSLLPSLSLGSSTLTLEQSIIVRDSDPDILLSCVDTDGDGVYDPIDIDDDNDGILDTLEAKARSLAYDFYDGAPAGSTTDNITALTLTQSGVVTEINVGELANDITGDRETYSVIYTGFIEAPLSGNYTFATWSDDGSKLYIDGLLVVDNDGLHPPETRSGTIDLTMGTHELEVRMFENTGQDELEVYWTIPGGSNELVPFEQFWIDCDTDGDGIVDRLDLDSDNDGIYDLTEAGHAQADVDMDGVIDGADTGSGANGLFDAVETSADSDIPNYTVADSDSDGMIDAAEVDADNDGCFDVIEADFTDGDDDGYLGDSSVTVDVNGIVTSGSDGYSGTTSGVTDPSSVAVACDTDDDGIAIFVDIDDDNDGIPDIQEQDCNTTIPGTLGTPTTVAGGTRVTSIFTDFSGYWTSTVGSVSPIQPNTEHSLIAFTSGGVTYSTGAADDNMLDQDANGLYESIDTDLDGNPDIACTESLWSAIPPALDITGETVLEGAAMDGNAGTALGTTVVADHFSDQLNVYLTNGKNGLGLGTSLANVGDSWYYPIGGIVESAINDGEPDIMMSQVAQPTSVVQTVTFFDAAGNVVGNAVSLDAVSGELAYSAGQYRTDVYFNSGATTANDLKNIRLATIEFSEMGITLANAGDVAIMRLELTANADVAFTAYNQRSFTSICDDRDTDGDGVVDRLDLDSDNDGIYDVVEGGDGASDTNGDGQVNSSDTGYTDTDLDGMDDTTEGTAPLDSDVDGAIDAIELDSDNDGCPDVIEAGFEDPDGDGLLGN